MQVGRSQSSEIPNPLSEISFFGKTREDPVEESRDDDDDDAHESGDAHSTIVDESLSKPKKERKRSKRNQGKDTH